MIGVEIRGKQRWSGFYHRWSKVFSVNQNDLRRLELIGVVIRGYMRLPEFIWVDLRWSIRGNKSLSVLWSEVIRLIGVAIRVNLSLSELWSRGDQSWSELWSEVNYQRWLELIWVDYWSYLILVNLILVDIMISIDLNWYEFILISLIDQSFFWLICWS